MFWTSFAQPQHFGDIWVKSMKDHVARVEAMNKEFERVEAQGADRASEALDEVAKLTRESMAYAQKLGAEWRKAYLDALKKSAEMFGGAA